MAKTSKPKFKRSYIGVSCPHCQHLLPLAQRLAGHVNCSYCRREYEALFFTPPQRRVHVAQVGTSGPQASASCAKHERNVAVANCDRCGNFMCNLCRIDAEHMALCPPCYERLSTEGALPSSVQSFKNYASMAGTAAVVGMFLWFLAVIFGPMAIYFSLKALKQRDEFGDAKLSVGIVFAMLIGALETVGGVLIILAMVGAIR